MMGWRYYSGLCLVCVVVFIWVTSAEISQRRFSEYRQPFVITYLAVSLMVIYLQISALKDQLYTWFSPTPTNHFPDTSRSSSSTTILEADNQYSLIVDKDIHQTEEGCLFLNEDDEHGLHLIHQDSKLDTWRTIQCSLYLTPIWFFNEYLSNSALANTSVASTTVLTSTSGLFTTDARKVLAGFVLANISNKLTSKPETS